MLYMPWQVARNRRLVFFSIKFAVALADTPFRKLSTPKQYRESQNIGRFTELINNIMMKQSVLYPPYIHLPTDILLKMREEMSMPVMAPEGDKSKDNPNPPSVKPSLVLIPGIDATQIPNNKLEVANKKPTEKIVRLVVKAIKFLIIRIQRRR